MHREIPTWVAVAIIVVVVAVVVGIYIFWGQQRMPPPTKPPEGFKPKQMGPYPGKSKGMPGMGQPSLPGKSQPSTGQ